MRVIRITNARVDYPGGEGLREANFDVEQGEFVYVCGASGAGKSTLLRLIYFGVFPTYGQVQVGQLNSVNVKAKEVALMRRQLGVVFQDFRLLEDRDVFENIAFVLRVTGARSRDIKRKVLRVLAEVGISHKRYKMPNELSGGEQQRVAIARAIVNDPFVLLADEPTGNLDMETAEEIMEILERINTRGTAVVMATHNFNLIEKFNHRVVRIVGGVTED